jgi:putative ABC transport system substrate-binding protein
MSRFILIILTLGTLIPSLSQAYDVLVLQSRRDPAYEEVLKGFRSVQKSSLRILVMADYAEVDVVRIVREDHPRLILAVGECALTAARKVQNTPVITLMSLAIHNQNMRQPNLTGIGMFAAPERYMTVFKSMKTRRIGVIHNPAKTRWYLQQARRTAEKAGIELVVREVAAPRDTLPQLSSLNGKVDALWMLPDTTAVTRETTEAFFLFSQEQGIPAVSFAGAYLGLGAAAVIDIDWTDVGRQAGSMAETILRGGKPADIPLELPRCHSPKTNAGVLKRLGLARPHPVDSEYEVGD